MYVHAKMSCGVYCICTKASHKGLYIYSRANYRPESTSIRFGSEQVNGPSAKFGQQPCLFHI